MMESIDCWGGKGEDMRLKVFLLVYKPRNKGEDVDIF